MDTLEVVNLPMCAPYFYPDFSLEAGMKNRRYTLIGSMMNRVPPVRSVYNALKRLMDMFDPKDQPELKAMKPVMCHFGDKGGTAHVH